MKKLGLFAVLVVLLMPFTFVKAVEDEIEIGLRNYLGDNYKERIVKKTNSENNIKEIESMFVKTYTGRTSDIVYPDYIGGLYIDEQDDEVVIQIVKEMIPSASKSKNDFSLYNSILAVDQNAKVEYVNYSYNEIYEVIDILEKYYTENYVEGNINAFYDDIINNRVVVELKNYSEDDISNFKREIIDSPLIDFAESSDTTDYLGTYYPGQSIPSLICSIGFRAKVGNEIGFVTAGHCVTGVNQSVALFGTVKKYKNSGNVDAAWVDLDSMYTMGSTLYYHPQVGVLSWQINNTPVTSFVVGQLYGKSGAGSKYTYGTITNNNYAASGLTQLIKTNAYATGGDSGGIVFKISGTGTNPTAYQTAGILKGGNGASDGNFYFVRADKVVSSFGLTTY